MVRGARCLYHELLPFFVTHDCFFFCFKCLQKSLLLPAFSIVYHRLRHSTIPFMLLSLLSLLLLLLLFAWIVVVTRGGRVFQCVGACSGGGRGYQTRAVECRGTDDPAQCPPHRRPRARRKCRRKVKCPRWVSSKWSQVAALSSLQL